ncbi:MAG TPA: hypothetical protein VJ529_02175 [Candidatus Bathyarchaeia archaeon]|nr:hypothetical protein [Candidatus Bathyarchaeia archaeon]
MAILIISSQSQAATFSELVEDRLKACHVAMNFFKDGLFFLREVQIWLDAPSTALGGIEIGSFSAQDVGEAVNFAQNRVRALPVQDVARTIVVFRGLWSIAEVSLAGYFSVQNDRNRLNVYGDIEISAYPQGEIRDIVDALWRLDNVNALVNQFVTSFQMGIKNLHFRLSRAVFCHGLWSRNDPSNIMAIYLTGSRRNLLGLFYDALKRQECPGIIEKTGPLDTKFFLNTLSEESLVDSRIDSRLEESLVTEIPVQSLLYIAREPDSFGKLFQELTVTVLKPALSKLPESSEVKKKISEGLSEYSK